MLVAGKKMLVECLRHPLDRDLFLEKCQVIGPVVSNIKMGFERLLVGKILHEA